VLINQRLEQSFKVQQQKALDEIYERWVQLFRLVDESYCQSRSIFIKNQILVLNKSVVLQNDYFSDLSTLFKQFELNCSRLMNIMTVDSKHLYFQVSKIQEHLDMANTLYGLLESKTYTDTSPATTHHSPYDFSVLKELTELKELIREEQQEFLKGMRLTKEFIQKQNKHNMDAIVNLCKKTEQEMEEKCMTNPILAFF